MLGWLAANFLIKSSRHEDNNASKIPRRNGVSLELSQVLSLTQSVSRELPDPCEAVQNMIAVWVELEAIGGKPHHRNPGGCLAPQT